MADLLKLDNLTDEQKAKLMACETPEELDALAKEMNMELTDEQLDAVSGGECSGYSPRPCTAEIKSC